MKKEQYIFRCHDGKECEEWLMHLNNQIQRIAKLLNPYIQNNG